MLYGCPCHNLKWPSEFIRLGPFKVYKQKRVGLVCYRWIRSYPCSQLSRSRTVRDNFECNLDCHALNEGHGVGVGMGVGVGVGASVGVGVGLGVFVPSVTEKCDHPKRPW